MRLTRFMLSSLAMAALLALNPVPGAIAAGTVVAPTPADIASETTMPSQYAETIKPELAAKYSYTQDGEYSLQSGLPTYQWMPTASPPRALVVAIHGLTLHGRRYRVLGRLMAVNGAGLVSMDMRGFGRCLFDDKKQFSTADDDRTRVNHEKSYEEIVKLISSVRAKNPGQRLVVMGESLGCTFAVRLAAEHGDLVDGIILSAPAVKVNPDMYVGHGNVRSGLKAAVVPSHTVNLNGFLRNLVSPRPEVVNEMVDDPFIVKKLSLKALLSTDLFVAKTDNWGKLVHAKLPILILQGSNDHCVSAKHVTDLMNSMPSDDQTLAWRGNYGHLQLETIFMRSTIVEALINWLHNHTLEMQTKMDAFKESIVDLGGKIM
jgi:acylglycerol lipase